VANYDEDALTMGVEASLGCADNHAQAWGSPLDSGTVRALIFASASSPYREKQAANVIGSVLEAHRSALMTDLGGSLRGGLTGIEVGRQFLKEAPSGAKALVVASDRRPAELRSVEEQAFGDGAAALLLGQDNVMASIDAHGAVNANFIHSWRRENDGSVHSGDTRFVENHGYIPLMSEAIRGLLKETGLKTEEVAKLIAYAPNARLGQQLARRLGFNPETQLADTLYRNVGDTGTAQVFLSLIGALLKAKPGERLVVAGYGDGAEVVLLTVTENIQKAAACRGIEAYLKRRRPMTTYGKYLQFRDVLGESSYDAFSSLPLLWREEKQNLKLYATKCKGCGVIHFPRRRVCDKCGAKDKMEDLKLGRKGRVYTYTNDHVYLNPDPPETLAVIDLEGGGRFFGQVVDINPQEMRIGLEMELSFRKLHDGQDVANYFWKARPAIGGK
jgi:3-hydroxy-3-methylglutaryl CoA synthase